jgi:hypothetical protein
VVQLVDTVEVEPARLDEYLEVVRTLGVPVMTGAGATLETCGTTPQGMGEPVTVLVVWSFEDYEHWNDIRRRLVLDPRWYDYARAAARLRAGGTRRFFTPTSFSPAPGSDTAAAPAGR